MCWWGGIPSQPLKGLEGLVGGVVGEGQHCVAELHRQLLELAVAKEHLVPRPARPQTQRRARAAAFGRGAGCCCDYAAAERSGRSQGRKTVLVTLQVTLRVTLRATWPTSTRFQAPIGPFLPPPLPPSRQTKARCSALSRMGSPARLLRLPAAAFDSRGASRQAVKRLEFEFKQSEFKTALNPDCLNLNSRL